MEFNFLGLVPPYCDLDRARYVVIPVPYDASTCYKAGARSGPEALLAASAQMELFDEETRIEAWKEGIHTLEPIEPVIDPEKMGKRVQQAVGTVIGRGKIPVIIGGDHSVSIGSIRAVHELYGPLNIIQIDAHADLRDRYQSSAFSHACVMRRIWDLGHVIQVGIRSLSYEEMVFLRGRSGRTLLWASQVAADLEYVLDAIRQGLKDLPTYITIDLDGLDPGIMPSVGTPEPGGLGWYETLSILRQIVEDQDIVGFDIVELAPTPGLHFADYTAARLTYKVMSYISRYKGL